MSIQRVCHSAAFVLVVLLLCLADGQDPRADASRISTADTRPVLLAKGEDFLIHHCGRYGSRGMTIFHTALPSGKTERIFVSGSLELKSRGYAYAERRLIGLAQDAERIYLAVWSFSTHHRQTVLRLMAHPGDTAALAQEIKKSGKQGCYELQVLRKKDGTSVALNYFVLEDKDDRGEVPAGWWRVSRDALATVRKEAGQVPFEIRAVGPGPLSLHKTGVSMFGISFEFAKESE